MYLPPSPHRLMYRSTPEAPLSGVREAHVRGTRRGLSPCVQWSILECGQAMIEPLPRGVDPVQLAFQSLASMGTRAQRAESPLAVALDRLGVDLARGESFTTAEAKQLVGLVRATLEVLETA